MERESSNKNLVIVRDEKPKGFTRWVPLLAVFTVLIGFIILSLYAYKAGTQSVNDEDLPVVEAEKTPIKEKPADPGGMKFPNQDKTIFDTFSPVSSQPPKVERVLPKPEEPIAQDTENADTSTFINEKLQQHDQQNSNKTPSGGENLIASDLPPSTKPEETILTPTVMQLVSKPHTFHESANQVKEAPQPQDEEQSETFIAPKTNDTSVVATPVATASTPSPSKPDTAISASAFIPPAVTNPTLAPAKPVKPISHGAFSVQLGAFRSDKEAMSEWNKIHLKQKCLSDKSPVIVKADLGEKGVYYRLRVGDLATVADAKSLCKTLVANSQACILPVEKQE